MYQKEKFTHHYHLILFQAVLKSHLHPLKHIQFNHRNLINPLQAIQI